MNKILYLFFLPVLLACEVVANFDIPAFQPSIVLNSVINPDSLVKVNLTENNFILKDSQRINPIEGAEVMLYENEQLVAQVPYLSNGNYVLDNGFLPVPGSSYRLEVNNPLYTSVLSEITLPENDFSSSVSSIQNYSRTHVDQFTSAPTLYYLEVTMDIKGFLPSDYYVLEFHKNEYTYDRSQTPAVVLDSTWVPMYKVNLGDPMSIEIYRTKFFFDGNQLLETNGNITCELQDRFSYKEKKYIQMSLKKVTEGYYKYQKDLIALNNQSEVSEPFNVYNNIENGFGIFGGYVEYVWDTVYY